MCVCVWLRQVEAFCQTQQTKAEQATPVHSTVRLQLRPLLKADPEQDEGITQAAFLVRRAYRKLISYPVFNEEAGFPAL